MTRFFKALALLLFVISPVFQMNAGAEEVTQEAFPPYGYEVLSNHATSGILTLRFSRVYPIDYDKLASNQQLYATYQVAGSPQNTPKLEITKMRFFRFLGNEPMGYVTYSAGDSRIPKDCVRIGRSGVLRQFQSYTLTVTMQQTRSLPNEIRTETLVLDSLKLNVDLGEAPLLTADEDLKAREFVPVSNPFSNRLVKLELLNPNIDHAYSITSPTKSLSTNWDKVESWTQTVNSTIEQGGVAQKYPILESGFYQVPSHVSGTSSVFDYYFQGEQLPVFYGSTSESLVFIPDFDKLKFGSEFIWALENKQQNNTEMLIPEHSPIQPLNDPSETTVSAKMSFSELNGYHPRLRANSDVVRWYWKSVTEDKTSVFNFEIPQGCNTDSGTTFVMNVFCQAPDPISENATVILTVNGADLPNNVFSGQTKNITLDIPGNLIKTGRNFITIRLRFTGTPSNKSDMLVQKIDLSWSDTMSNILKDDAYYSSVSLTRSSNLPSENVYDTKSPTLATHIDRLRLFSPISSGTLTYYNLGLTAGQPVYVVPQSPNQLPKPMNVSRLKFPNAQNSADALFITTSPFISQLSTLADYRASQGWKTEIVDVEDIFNSFSYGVRSPTAIRQFLAWRFYNSPPPKLQSVLLVGEASEYKLPIEQETDNSPAVDYIPVNGGPRANEARGDQEYSLLAGEDQLADILVGRLPVKNSDDLDVITKKIIKYENTQPGHWSLHTVFTYDDNDEFVDVVSDVKKNSLTPFGEINEVAQGQYYYGTNSKVTYRKRAYGATEALVETFNRGTGMLNYFGHGGPNLWSHERMFHLSDLSRLNNEKCLPFVTCSSCDTAWLDYPLPPVKTSIGEALLLKKNAGAIGVFAPVDGASPYEHKTLMTHLNMCLWRLQERLLGATTAFAKNLYFSSTNSTSICQQYVLVGDPLTRLNIPTYKVDRDVFSIEPSTVASNETSVTIRANIRCNIAEAYHLQIIDPSGKSIYLSTVSRDELAHEYDIVLPALQTGRYCVLLLPILEHSVLPKTVYIYPFNAELPTIVVQQSNLSANQTGTDKNDGSTVSLNNISDIPINDLQLARTSKSAVADSSQQKNGLSETLKLDLPAGGSCDIFVPTHQEDSILYFAGTNARFYPAKSITVGPKRADTEQSTVTISQDREIILSPTIPDVNSYLRLQFEIMNSSDADTTNILATARVVGSELATSAAIEQLAPFEKRGQILSFNKTLPIGRHIVEITLEDKTTGLASTPRFVDVDVVAPPSLYFLPGSVKITSHDGQDMANETLFVTGKIANKGHKESGNILVEILKTDPATGTPQESYNGISYTTVKGIGPNKSTDFSFRWENFNNTGDGNYYLVMNRTSSINKGELPNESWTTLSLPLSRLSGDLMTSNIKISHTPVEPGMPILILGDVLNVGSPLTRQNIDLSVSLYNTATGKSKEDKVQILPDFTRTTGFYETVRTVSGYPYVRVNVNASREMSEVNPTNNMQEIPLTLLFNDTDLPVSDQGYSLEKILDSFVTENIELIPDIGFRLLDNFTSTTDLLEISPENVVSGDIVSSHALTNADKNDGKWLVLPWLARAWPVENAGILSFSYPVGAPRTGLKYDAKVLVTSGNNYEGRPVGSFLARTTSGSEFQRFDPSALPTTTQDSWISLGRTTLDAQGNFTPEFKQVGDSTAFFKAFQLKPMQAILLSPAIRLSKACDIVPTVTTTLNIASSVTTQIRLSQPNGTWSEWKPVTDTTPVTIQQPGTLVQLLIYVTPEYNTPNAIINNIALKEVTR